MKKILPFLIWLLISLSYFGLSGQNLSFDWLKQTGSSGADNITTFNIDPFGNYIITGSFSDKVDFDPGPGLMELNSKKNSDNFIAKYSAEGQLLNVKQFSDTLSFYKTIIDNEGNLIIYGYFKDAVDFDPGADSFIVASEFSSGLFIAKYNNDLEFIRVIDFYNIVIPHDTYDNPFVLMFAFLMLFHQIGTDDLGNIYSMGAFTGTMDMDPGPGIDSVTATNSPSFALVKFDSSGNYVWSNQIGGENLLVLDLFVSPSQNIYVTGRYSSDTIYFDNDTFLVKNNHLTPGNFIVKYAPDGLWLDLYQIEGDIFISNIFIDESSNIYLTGTFSNFTDSIDFDMGSGSHYLKGSPGFPTFLAKYDTNGNLEWVNKIGKNGAPLLASPIITDTTSNLYFIGKINKSIGKDVFVTLFDPKGNEIWDQKILNTVNQNDLGIINAQIFNNNIYVAGNFYSNASVVTNNALIPFASSGSSDIFVAKFTNTSVGIINLTNFNELVIYPNPTTGKFQIDHFYKGELIVTIFDITGKAISKKVINTSGKKEFEIEGNPGIYFIELLTEVGEKRVFKIVKI